MSGWGKRFEVCDIYGEVCLGNPANPDDPDDMFCQTQVVGEACYDERVSVADESVSDCSRELINHQTIDL